VKIDLGFNKVPSDTTDPPENINRINEIKSFSVYEIKSNQLDGWKQLIVKTKKKQLNDGSSVTVTLDEEVKTSTENKIGSYIYLTVVPQRNSEVQKLFKDKETYWTTCSDLIVVEKPKFINMGAPAFYPNWFGAVPMPAIAPAIPAVAPAPNRVGAYPTLGKAPAPNWFGAVPIPAVAPAPNWFGAVPMPASAPASNWFGAVPMPASAPAPASYGVMPTSGKSNGVVSHRTAGARSHDESFDGYMDDQESLMMASDISKKNKTSVQFWMLICTILSLASCSIFAILSMKFFKIFRHFSAFHYSSQ
jgi:hypothetical protein